MKNLDRALKSRDVTLLTKFPLVKGKIFPVIMCGCESWTIKKAECWRIDAFELWCWRRLESPLDYEEINQSILKEINPEYFWKDWCGSWNSNTLATWCEELTHQKRPCCWERLKAGGEGDDRGWDSWMALPAWWTWVWTSSESWWWTGNPGVLQSMGSQRGRHNWVTELDWTFLHPFCSSHFVRPLRSLFRYASIYSDSAVKNLPAMHETQEMWFNPWDRKIPWRRKWQPTLVFLLENPMNRGVWWATKSRTWLWDWAHTHTHKIQYTWHVVDSLSSFRNGLDSCNLMKVIYSPCHQKPRLK